MTEELNRRYTTVESHDLAMALGKTLVLPNGVTLMPTLPRDTRPATVKITTADGEIDVVGFAGMRLSSEHARGKDRFHPVCEVVFWNGKALLVGMQSLVIAGTEQPLIEPLFRREDEDIGFYAFKWIELDDHLMCIYESGVIGFDADAKPRWHINKYWDDVFQGITQDGLLFEGFDEQPFVIDPVDGTRRSVVASKG